MSAHHDLSAGYLRRTTAKATAPSDTPADLTQAELLLGMAETAELFHSPDGREYATVPLNGHHETWSFGQRGLRLWLTKQFFDLEQKPPNRQALDSTLDVLRARARFDGKERQVFVRLGHGNDGALYLDRGTPNWDAVRVTADGWELVPHTVVRFRRPNGLGGLPVPVSGGDLRELRQFINVQDDQQWTLLRGWLVAALWPRGPYPVLVVEGEQGSAKSGLARTLRALLDPCTAPLRTAPRDERDLMIAATNSLIVSYDNVSTVSPWFSDALCRLSTGGGMSTRELYTNEDEIVFDAQRPVILTGIANLCERDDLRDRAIGLTLREIPDEARRSEAELSVALLEAQPRILGALLTAVSTAMRRLGNVRLSRAPRMADFARLATAAEPSLGLGHGDFLRAYDASRAEAVEASLDLNPLATAIRDIATSEGWIGTATELLKKLTDTVTEQITKGKDWPKTPTALSTQLTRMTPSLRKVGIIVERPPRRGHGRTRQLRVRHADAVAPGGRGVDAKNEGDGRRDNPVPQATLATSAGAAGAADAEMHALSTDWEQGDAWEEEAA